MNQKTTLQQQSHIFNALRFPLACLVIIIHCKINQAEWKFPQWGEQLTGIEISSFIQLLFSNIISGIAVPTFFVMSGYFFFFQTKTFNIDIYLAKLQKRIHTLFIPYMIWNILYILYIIIRKIVNHFIKGEPLSNIIHYLDINGWLRIFWDCNIWSLDSTNILGYSTPHTGPILIPMWFIRDLIVTVLITPIIYEILKKLKIWAISILAICYITGIWPYIHGFSITAIFFFCFGAYFSIHNLNMINELKRTRKWIFYLYFLTIILMIFLHGDLTTVGQRIYPIYIIIGVMTIINLATILEENVKLPINNTLSKTTFFIYAFHGLIALEIASIILKMPFPTEDNNWQNVIIHYCLKPFLTLGICLTSYYIMQKYTPHLLNILTGNRNIKKE